MTRQRLLREAGVPYRVIGPGVDEEAAKVGLRAEGLSPRELADALAELKARCGFARTQVLTLGCDQTLEWAGQSLDKAADLASLRTQLSQIRGHVHLLHSAAVLVDSGYPVWRHVSTSKLRMRRFSDDFMDSYIREEGQALLSCVGGYRVEGIGAQLFDLIEGDTFSIQGLPLLPLLEALRQRGIVRS